MLVLGLGAGLAALTTGCHTDLISARGVYEAQSTFSKLRPGFDSSYHPLKGLIEEGTGTGKKSWWSSLWGNNRDGYDSHQDHDHSGYGYHDEYNQGGYDQGGYDQGGFDQGGYVDQGGYSQGGYDQGGYTQGSYEQPGQYEYGYDQQSGIPYQYNPPQATTVTPTAPPRSQRARAQNSTTVGGTQGTQRSVDLGSYAQKASANGVSRSEVEELRNLLNTTMRERNNTMNQLRQRVVDLEHANRVLRSEVRAPSKAAPPNPQLISAVKTIGGLRGKVDRLERTITQQDSLITQLQINIAKEANARSVVEKSLRNRLKTIESHRDKAVGDSFNQGYQYRESVPQYSGPTYTPPPVEAKPVPAVPIPYKDPYDYDFPEPVQQTRIPPAPRPTPEVSSASNTSVGTGSYSAYGDIPPGSYRKYRVKKGDYASNIAQRYGVKLSDIMNANPSVNIDHIKIDDILMIPIY